MLTTRALEWSMPLWESGRLARLPKQKNANGWAIDVLFDRRPRGLLRQQRFGIGVRQVKGVSNRLIRHLALAHI